MCFVVGFFLGGLADGRVEVDLFGACGEVFDACGYAAWGESVWVVGCGVALLA